MKVHTSEGSQPPFAAEFKPDLDEVRAHVDRILLSDTFRAAEVLRRLFRFLADKTFSGEAEGLKEYSVGIDALGKPPSYDPSKDAIVRLQASRLRQKLDDYYRKEGQHDAVVIELPKGRFKLTWHMANGTEFPDSARVPPAPVASPVEPRDVGFWKSLAISLGVAFLALGVLTIWSFSRAPRALPAAHLTARTTPELTELWRPFLSPGHHVLLGFSNPFFVRLQESGYRDIIYHTMNVNSWEDAKASPELSVLSRALGNPKVTPTFNMVERSTLLSTFVLSRFLSERIADISLVRSSDVSWQHLADNDVILLTTLHLDQGDSALLVQPAFAVGPRGVINLQPQPGEPAVYEDPQDHQDSDGQGLELVSMFPGPLGRTSVLTFSSNHAWGIICGVQALTDPAFARELVARLRMSSGKIPSYYQVVLRMSYRDGTPTKASYVTHRMLSLK